MKKIPAIVLLTILLLNAAGFYVYYIIELQRIHTAMRAQLRTLDDDKLTRLSLTHAAYAAAFVEEDEIRVNGLMYDIGRVRFSKDSVVVFALHDEREDDLLLLLNDIISKPFHADADVASHLMNYYSLVYFPAFSVVNNTKVDGAIIKHFTAYQLTFHEPGHHTFFQPPRS